MASRHCLRPERSISTGRNQRGPWLEMIVFSALALTLTGCRPQKTSSEQPSAHGHEHVAPHGGTPVVLGTEAYHLEFVREAKVGKLTVFLLDGEMENFVRSTETSVAIDATVNGRNEPLILRAVANAATGETLGDTSQFEAQAEWLKTAATFDATLRKITVRGSTFENVVFNFPGGNEKH